MASPMCSTRIRRLPLHRPARKAPPCGWPPAPQQERLAHLISARIEQHALIGAARAPDVGDVPPQLTFAGETISLYRARFTRWRKGSVTVLHISPVEPVPRRYPRTRRSGGQSPFGKYRRGLAWSPATFAGMSILCRARAALRRSRAHISGNRSRVGRSCRPRARLA